MAPKIKVPKSHPPKKLSTGQAKEHVKDVTDTGPPQEHQHNKRPTDEELSGRHEEAKAKKEKVEKEAKENGSKRNAALAALGIAGAVAGGIAAAALADYVASDGAVINLTNITPGNREWLNLYPKKLQATWTVKKVPAGGIASNVTILKGDSVDISGTGITYPSASGSTPINLDGQSVVVLDVPSENVFVFEPSPQTSNTSDLTASKGEGVIHTSYDDHFNKGIADVTADVTGAGGGLLDGLLKGLSGVIGPLLLFLAVAVAVYFGFQFFSGLSSTGKNQ
jgi:hypothetical protein